MERDKKLILAILYYVKTSEGPMLIKSGIPGYPDSEQVACHIGLCCDSGFLIAEHSQTMGLKYGRYVVHRLTSSGYDHLEANEKLVTDILNRRSTLD